MYFIRPQKRLLDLHNHQETLMNLIQNLIAHPFSPRRRFRRRSGSSWSRRRPSGRRAGRAQTGAAAATSAWGRVLVENDHHLG